MHLVHLILLYLLTPVISDEHYLVFSILSLPVSKMLIFSAVLINSLESLYILFVVLFKSVPDIAQGITEIKKNMYNKVQEYITYLCNLIPDIVLPYLLEVG